MRETTNSTRSANVCLIPPVTCDIFRKIFLATSKKIHSASLSACVAVVTRPKNGRHHHSQLPLPEKIQTVDRPIHVLNIGSGPFLIQLAPGPGIRHPVGGEFVIITCNRQPELAFIEVAPGGWKSYEMVLRYAHLASEYLTDADSRIETLLESEEQHSTISLR